MAQNLGAFAKPAQEKSKADFQRKVILMEEYNTPHGVNYENYPALFIDCDKSNKNSEKFLVNELKSLIEGYQQLQKTIGGTSAFKQDTVQQLFPNLKEEEQFLLEKAKFFRQCSSKGFPFGAPIALFDEEEIIINGQRQYLITLPTLQYDAEQFKKPWVAKVDFVVSEVHGKHENRMNYGYWVSKKEGYSGELRVMASEGDVIQYGQRPKTHELSGSSKDGHVSIYSVVQEGGALREATRSAILAEMQERETEQKPSLAQAAIARLKEQRSSFYVE